MKLTLNGWWFSVSVYPRIELHDITEAEKLEKFLREVGNNEDADKIRQHIKDQEDGKFLKMENYTASQLEI
jgi:hypothetical protein